MKSSRGFARPPKRAPPIHARSGTGSISVCCATTTPARFSAGKLLSRATPNDPLALWAYLYSVGGRETATGRRALTVVNRGMPAKDTTPPLPPQSSIM